MDNNFDENNSMPDEEYNGNGAENIPEDSSAAPAQEQNGVPQESPAENINAPTENGTYAGGQQYAPGPIPPLNGGYGAMPGNYGQPQGYIPPQGVPPAPAKKRRLSGGCLWILLITAIALFGVIIILAARISMEDKAGGHIHETTEQDTKYDNLSTQSAEHTEIKLPTSARPVLEEELYENKETGLLTTVGVAEMVLPSQVKIEVFDEIPYLPVSSGSGIVISSDGYILTNAHVVDGADSLAVKFYDGTSEKAAFIGMDRKSDLAVIKVNRDDLTSAEIGVSSSLVIGEEVALAGAGGGFENTVTYGHVTGLDRTIDTDYISSSSIHCIQTDAALNPGNSGGALVNMYGQVVGVAVALMNHETYENIGFSIAIDDAVPIAEDLIAHGYVTSRSRVGISFVSIEDAAARGYGIMPGLCVMDIDPDCGVYYSDIIPYDIITHIDGMRVYDSEDIAEALKDNVPGETIMLTVFRKSVTGETDVFDVPVELAPDTSSLSGYPEAIGEEDFFSRDIIN